MYKANGAKQSMVLSACPRQSFEKSVQGMDTNMEAIRLWPDPGNKGITSRCTRRTCKLGPQQMTYTIQIKVTSKGAIALPLVG